MKQKIKDNIVWFIVTFIIIWIPVLVGLIWWDKLPDKMPIHWGISGEADGYASKPIAVFLVAILLSAVQIIFVFILTVAKSMEQKPLSDKVYKILLLIFPIVSIYIGVVMYGAVFERRMNVSMTIQLMFAMVSILLGNYMPKVKQNGVVGVRLPWTLKDGNNWNKTNRLGGRLMVIVGFIFLLNSFLQIGGEKGAMICLMGSLLIMVIIVTLYSYIIYKKDNK